jgi:thermostable 8-oxoguanine DNA glycosylase
MVPITLSAKQLAMFQNIQDNFREKTPQLDLGKWHLMSDNEIWLRVVSQVVVVGNEAPARHLSDTNIKARLTFDTLADLPPLGAAQALGAVLADIGTRYVSQKQPQTSRKVKALLKNLAFLRTFSHGPHGLVEHLARMATSRERIDYLSRNFSYLKAKGARDFLTTGLGMATDVIALDSRVMGIVRLIVPDLPSKVSERNYGAIEEFLIEQVCKPLGMSAAEFDQLLFHNKPAIEGSIRSVAVLPSVRLASRLKCNGQEYKCRRTDVMETRHTANESRAGDYTLIQPS